jgi:hypothetical protein
MATKTSVLMLGGSLTSYRLVSFSHAEACHVSSSCSGILPRRFNTVRGNLSRRNAGVLRSHQAMIVDTHVDVVSHLMDA